MSTSIKGTVYSVEFADGADEDKPAGTYVTIRADDPELAWGAGRVAISYIPKQEAAA